MVARLLAERLEALLLGALTAWQHAVRDASTPLALETAYLDQQQNAILARRNGVACKLLSKNMGDKLELLLGGVLAVWHWAVKATRQDQLDAAQQSSRQGLCALVSRLLAEQLEGLVLGMFKSWRYAVRDARTERSLTALDDRRDMAIQYLTQRNSAACKLVSKHIVDGLQLLLVGVLISWRDAVRRTGHQLHHHLVARLLAEKLEALVLGAFASWRR
eukprot:1341674-Amphidinium_carterae.1